MKLGQFIVIEGLEGAGKSTAIQTCQDFLSQHNMPCISTREPGGTYIAEKIRALFKEIQEEPLNAKTELLLLYAARVQHIEYLIKPALARGSWVICDRFEMSTFAYQGGGRGIKPEILQFLSQFCLEDFAPSLTIFMDINPEQGLSRARARGAADRIEEESLAFFTAVSKSYHQQLEKLKNVVLIDAHLPIDDVQSNIRRILENCLYQYEHSQS